MVNIRLFLFAGPVLAATLAGATGSAHAAAETVAAPRETPVRGGKLEFAVDSEPANYDCHANISFAFLHPVAPHYSTLLKFDAASYPEVKGDLAESWTVSPDRQTYTFKLRPNVLFHDGTKMSAADVKASYDRIVRPPQGVLSARQVNYSAITSIDTPDERTVVFKLKWPEAAMLANFASPWNCIYSAQKLKTDPDYPKSRVMGTGPFTFVEHVPGKHWAGKRFDKYFQPGKPYLDGYQADFMTGKAMVDAIKAGRALAQFRSVTPAERDAVVEALGDRATVSESPWLIDLMLVFNATKKPFDDGRVRRALSLAIDRWQAAETLSGTTFLKYVGGVMRPGFAMATPEASLVELPGFSRDIAAARAEAKRLLAEAGVKDLKIKLTNRDIAMPYGPGGDYLIEAWRAIGVTATQEKLNTKEWQGSLEKGNFEAALDFAGDYFDDPTLQLTKYVSKDLSPVNFSGATDRFLDALYVGQALTTRTAERAKIVRDFERRAMTEAYSVPFLWWNRIVVTSSRLKGWNITPSHYLEQDLTDVWLTP
jgi:peptide/nickel transport system substrate-binding protein